MPPVKPGLVQECGLFSESGDYIPRGAVWRRNTPICVPPTAIPEAEERLEGRWLWGGILYDHFGHFLVESTARLWPLPDRRGDLDGVIFAPRNPSEAPELTWFQAELFRHLIGDFPVKLIARPTRIAALDVPGQGFGMGRIAGGTKQFRAYIETDFARTIAPYGPERLFLSRSKLPYSRGGFVGEAILDERMARAGYEIFHPEEHDIATQLARYKAARQVVALDGSALHLCAMVARRPQQVAVLLRRRAVSSRALLAHLEKFMGAPPHVVSVFSGEEKVAGKKAWITDLDFAAMGAALHAGGFLPDGHHWGALTDSELEDFAEEEARAKKRFSKARNAS